MNRFFILIIAVSQLGLSSNEVTTSSGIVGAETLAQGLKWNDIPYALPPVAELRWKAPRAFENFTQRITNQTGNGCMQEATEYAGVTGEGIVGQEDCLYLDIYTPETFANQQMPVMFWIHGGGNTSGWKDYYDFSKLASEHEVVVVTINYRLGPLGWFAHPLIQEAAEGLDQSSNFGTLDIIEALKWVQKNIATFGGNPNNVTIFGASAGGHNVLALLASPLTKGLFHKAIGQSSYTTSYTFEMAHSTAGSFLSSANALTAIQQQSKQDYLTAKDLRSIPAKDLLQAYNGLDAQTYDYLPITIRDGIVIPKEGLKSALANNAYNKNIPIMLGANKDEISLYIGISPYFIKKSYPFTRLLPILRLTIRNPDLYAYWLKTRSDAWKIRGVDEPLAQLSAAGANKLFAYRFDWDEQKKSFFADFPKHMGAAHGYEIAFLTGEFKYGPITNYVYPNTPSRDTMAAQTMYAWAHFAKWGVPKLNADIAWPVYNLQEKPFMKLDSTFAVALEKHTLEGLVTDIFISEVGLSDLQKCLMARDTLTNIGDNKIQELPRLSQGLCNQFQLDDEYRKLEKALIAQYGSLSVL